MKWRSSGMVKILLNLFVYILYESLHFIDNNRDTLIRLIEPKKKEIRAIAAPI